MSFPLNTLIKIAGNMRILPVLILCLALSFGVRLSEFVTGGGGFAYAKEEALEPDLSPDISYAQNAISPESGQADEEEGASSVAAEEHADVEPVKEEGGHEEAAETWRDSMDSDLEFSSSKMELFQDLSHRRDDLDSRERELSMREALLKAAEQEMDQKYKELVSLRGEIEALLETQSEEEEKRIASLVKIYEGMKAKSAARIFDTLDMRVLIQVIGQMSERKSAPVIAAMNPDRARHITIMLAEQRRLPDLSEGLLR